MNATVSAAAAQGVVYLADWGNKDLTGGRGAEFGKASPVGLLLILALLAGIVFLMRSMNRHLRKVPKSFDADADAGGTTGGDGADGPDTPGGPEGSGGGGGSGGPAEPGGGAPVGSGGPSDGGSIGPRGPGA